MIQVVARPGIILPLGRQGEHEARCILFDVGCWQAHFPGGAPALAVQRAGDGIPYPVDITAEGNLVVWRISNADLSAVGPGRCELSWYMGETIVKSQTYATLVEASLTADGSTIPPEEEQSWVDKVLQTGAKVEALSQHPPKPGSDGYWMLWDHDQQGYVPSDIPLPDGGGTGYIIGHGLHLDEETNSLSVQTAEDFTGDNTLPITAAAVQTTVGNIRTLLETI